ncbi:hypothetical protein JTE90_010082 [Oedothorax gibbosus]|uniref:Uncharacterized protein n=1 Tax=Oedothorax gibbosus TaxID=931172 RepID=A0AAV6U3L5_9ARAC|nr:hypothetical protein JTE90_010082 [Oedothorax gibbosus]
MSVMPENEPPHYDTDAVTGNEIYPERDGDHFYIATTDETRIFAKKKDGTPYYARKSTGEEFYPHINGLPVYVYDPDQSVRYALDALGKPVYPKDAQGDEIYVRRKDGRMSIGKNKEENHVYARKNVLLRSESYYPEDGGIGYRKDGTPVYCTRPEEPFVLYPTDAQGNEFYLREKNSQSDFIHYADDDDPKAILWMVVSYARDRLGNDIYPVRALDGGLTMDVIPVTLSYAHPRGDQVYRDTLDVTQLFATRDGKSYYARRANGSEYYPTVDGGHVLLSDAGGKERYARRRQKEIYPRGRDGRDYVILVQGRPVYATDEEGRAYYPQGGDGKEYLVSMEWIHHNGPSSIPFKTSPLIPRNQPIPIPSSLPHTL